MMTLKARMLTTTSGNCDEASKMEEVACEA